MLNAIIHNFIGDEQTLRPWAASPAGDGFDTANKQVDFPGTITDFHSKYEIGGEIISDRPSMYCSGFQIEREAHGWITATIFARGFWNNKPNDVITISSSFSDRLFPFSNGGITWYLPGSMVGKGTGPRSNTNPITGKPWRIRQVGEKFDLSRSGVTIIPATSSTAWRPPALPTAVAGGRPEELAALMNEIDPLYSTKSGWVSQGMQTNPVAVLGEYTLLSWRDSFQWIDRVTD